MTVKMTVEDFEERLSDLIREAKKTQLNTPTEVIVSVLQQAANKLSHHRSTFIYDVPE